MHSNQVISKEKINKILAKSFVGESISTSEVSMNTRLPWADKIKRRYHGKT